ncbi:MAG: hypothetical protein BWY19_00572 [bacterium ADurb.Bin212]|nr:MAG: hypothetical protein BWY19_00572 [bacterium ADurb.Bin212]
MDKTLEERIQKIEEEVSQILARNKKVEADKGWETSYLRRTFVAIFTYLPIAIYMWAINVPSPWLNAVVPTLGFLISTLALPWFKQIWQKSQIK